MFHNGVPQSGLNGRALPGHLIADPNRVPKATGIGEAPEGAFARELADASTPEAPAPAPEARAQEAAAAPAAPVADPNTPVERTPRNRPGAQQARGKATAQPQMAQKAGDAEPKAESTEPGKARIAQGADGSDRRITPGKGPDLSAPSFTGVEQAASAQPTVAVPWTSALAGQAAKAGARTQGVTPIGESGQVARTARASLPTRAAGFRSMNPQMVRMAEMARDSVFKQILFKVQDGGGQMRVRLDPQDLGRLDLDMQLQSGGAFRLGIVAERPEVAAMLERGMQELKGLLGGQGLDVVAADVQSGQGDTDWHGFMDQSQGTAPGWDTPDGGDQPQGVQTDDAQDAQHSGWLSADGLDFWV